MRELVAEKAAVGGTVAAKNAERIFATLDAARSSDLSTAWAAAQAALPEGWHMGELKNTSYRGVNPNGESERWLAMAWAENDERTFEHGYGDSPVLALAALTARLQARSTEQGGAG